MTPEKQIARLALGLGLGLGLGLLTSGGIGPGCDRTSVDREGKPITIGRFRLRTFPTGARVWVNGELKVDQTPATFVLEEGTYHFTIQAPGAEAMEKTVEIGAASNLELNLTIPRPPPATITVLSDVEGASVRINGYRRGATPLDRAVTKPGPLDITLSSVDGRARSIRADLAIAEQKLIEVFFGEVASEAQVTPEPVRQSVPPETGRVTLGLQPAGTVSTPEGTILGRSPLTGHPMRPGEHPLLLRSLDGRYEKRVTIEVAADRASVYRFMFGPADEVAEWTADGGTMK